MIEEFLEILDGDLWFYMFPDSTFLIDYSHLRYKSNSYLIESFVRLIFIGISVDSFISNEVNDLGLPF